MSEKPLLIKLGILSGSKHFVVVRRRAKRLHQKYMEY
jgi:hypothetical protein